MRCPICIVGELKLGAMVGIEAWVCTDVGRGWNTDYPQREMTQFGYCGISFPTDQGLPIIRGSGK